MSIEVTKFSVSELRKMNQGETRLFKINSSAPQQHIGKTARREQGRVLTELVMLTRKSFDTEKHVLVECLEPLVLKQAGVKSD